MDRFHLKCLIHIIDKHHAFWVGDFFVNKSELIEHIAKHADISKAAAARALEATVGAVKTTLKKGGTVSSVSYTHLTLPTIYSV